MTQPAWVRRTVESIRAAHRLALVIFVPPAPPAREPLLARWFHRVDEPIFGRAADGMTPSDLTPLLDGVTIANAAPDTLPHALREVDVVVAFDPLGAGGLPETVEVWAPEHDALWEFVTRQPAMRAVLRSGGRVLATTTARPDPVSFRRAMSRLGLRIAAMIEHQLERRGRRSSAPAEAAPPAAEGEHSVSNKRMFLTALGAARNWMTQKYRERYTRGQWSIAFAFGETARALELRDFHALVPPDDRMWADPFVVVEDGRAWVFVEELIFKEEIGALAVLEVRPDGTWTEPRRILDRPYHLSYPCVFRWNGGFYMVPETQQNRTIELYRCVEFPYRWEEESVLMQNVDAVDATVFDANGRWWMYFATDSGDAAGFDRLWLFHADSPRGPWVSHPWNPLTCDVAGGRPGGRPFRRRGKLVRATQEGAPWYGHAMRLREIVTLTPDAWEEREVGRIRPDFRRGLEGTHTLNVEGDVAVIDALRVRRAH